MAYLCSMCVWCPQRLGERVGSPGTKVTNGCKSLCGCWVLPKSNKHSLLLLLLFLGTGFLCSFRPVLEATSALNHRADATDLKIRISYQYLTSAQCSTSIFLIIYVHVRDSRDRDYEGICRCTRGSQRTTSGVYTVKAGLWCF